MSSFKPMLCPNEKVDLSTIKYPILASTKLDGIRCIFHPTLGMVSRSLKPIPSKQLNEKFKPILQWCKENQMILDGEIYAEGRTFQEITRAVMTEDLTSVEKMKEFMKQGMEEPGPYVAKLLDDMMFYCFDSIIISDGAKAENSSFAIRDANIQLAMGDPIHRLVVGLTQTMVNNQQEVLELFEENLKLGYEGLILKDPNGKYKFGRGTLKEGLCYKVKPFIEKSGIIKGFVQSTVVSEDAEKTINELGRSVTSKKKDDRILIEKCSAFVIDYNGQDLKITIAATDVEKEEIWKNQQEYLGKEVCYKSMEVGAKDLPRHPVAVRWWKHDE